MGALLAEGAWSLLVVLPPFRGEGLPCSLRLGCAGAGVQANIFYSVL